MSEHVKKCLFVVILIRTCSKAIDLKNLVKLGKYAGEKEKFKDFEWQLYVDVRVLNPQMLTDLEWVEKHTETDYSLAKLGPDKQKLASEAYTLLPCSARIMLEIL